MNAPESRWRERRRLVASTAIAAVLLVSGPLIMSDLGWESYGGMAHAKCCFTAETIVLLHDGTPREIHTIEIGDLVLGQDGDANKVVGIERVSLGSRKLFAINGSVPFFTEEHPFLSTNGWRSANPLSSYAEVPSLRVNLLETGNELIGIGIGPLFDGATAIVPKVQQRTIPLIKLEATSAPAETELFNLLLDGDHTYVANGFVVHNKGGEGGEGGEGGDSDGGGEGGDSDGGGEGGDSDGGGEGGDSDGGGEGGDSDGGGEGGDSDSGGEGGERGDDDRGDDGGEGGERGDDDRADEGGEGGERGRGRGRGRGGDSDRADDAGEGGEGGDRGSWPGPGRR